MIRLAVVLLLSCLCIAVSAALVGYAVDRSLAAYPPAAIEIDS